MTEQEAIAWLRSLPEDDDTPWGTEDENRLEGTIAILRGVVALRAQLKDCTDCLDSVCEFCQDRCECKP